MALSGAVDFDAIRKDFPIFDSAPEALHYLDSAASSQKPQCVIDAVAQCYRSQYGPVHRGLYPLAEAASEAYEKSRRTLGRFINAASADEIVFTRSATEAINLVASGWAGPALEAGDEVWVSQMEHHSNYLPWQRVCRDRGAKLRVIPLDSNGLLDLEGADSLFGDKTRLIAITQVSNVLGVINPVAEITARASQKSIPVLVDAAQSVGHMPVDVQALDCDFLVASAHKMCGPGGIGFLFGKKERLAQTEPLLLGGGMVDQVQGDSSTWSDIPARFEAGSPNLAGALGFAVAADYIEGIGRQAIEKWEQELAAAAFEVLSGIDGVSIYGPENSKFRSGILSFNIDGIHPHDVAQIAGEHGVAIRAGHHCCQPLMQHLNTSSTARASFSFYNNRADIAALEMAIHETRKVLGR
ncbi:MAG: SufS family cysteine desulfurase [Gammaproteobacteria bacterium]|nr:SufS family cysteine desulfurase [Gammaproteobacteria bacterium]